MMYVLALFISVRLGLEATHDDKDERIGRYHHGRPHSYRNEEFDSNRRGNETRGGGGSDGEYGHNYRRPRHCTSEGDDDYRRYRDHGIASSTGTSSAGGDKRPSKRPKQQKRIWPPPFDTDGALYVFDSRSGFFYEAESNFYFDPKSRYYYSIDAAAYFQHYKGQEPPFRKVSPQQEEEKKKKEEQKKREMDKHTISDAEQAGLPATISNNEGGEVGSGKMKIAISLKTKTPLGSGATRSTSSLKSPMDTRIVENSSMVGRERQSSPTTQSRGIKQIQAQAYDADIAKWNNARSSNTTTSTSSIPADYKNTPKTTKAGQPICLLCRRKFANTEALQKHEQSSALHKQNLAKKKRDPTNSGVPNPSGAESNGKSSIEYRDRAKDRRSMYGIESSHGEEAAPLTASTASSTGIASTVISSASAVDIGPSLEKARPVVSAELVRPSDALGDSNIGSQMLKKLGWKQGSSLGREQGNSDVGHGRGSDANAQMVKEWETIETAAAASSQTAAAREGTNNNNSRAGVGAGRSRSR